MKKTLYFFQHPLNFETLNSMPQNIQLACILYPTFCKIFSIPFQLLVPGIGTWMETSDELPDCLNNPSSNQPIYCLVQCLLCVQSHNEPNWDFHLLEQ